MDEAVQLLDQWLQLTVDRTMFSADEIRDLLLDFRQAITRPVEPIMPTDTLEPVPN